ncbi:MAG: formate dehydrogenase subunit gamma [Desulfuromonadales bacterium]|nr:MAG: formate dehydrogenase subunit gamma [Desulfuromonadales bacterium]
MASRYVERFSAKERVLHWFVTIAFFILVFSGLGLYSRLFTGWFDLFGGGKGAILFHKIAGLLFFASSLLLFLSHRKEITTFDEDDRDWVTKRGGYLSREEEHFNSGKFNAGQKLFGIFIGAATVALGVSGVFIWAPTAFPRLIVQFSLLLHGLTFVLAVMFVIVHIYLATIGNPGTLEGMLYGHVRRIWARKHHPKWYREVGE